MGVKKISAFEFKCDNPKCEKTQRLDLEEDFIGLRGDVVEATNSGGSGAEWFACSRKCVGPAVAAAIDKAWDNEE